jgi:peptidyl-prolyl cis-trans isomerase B (cyclophilin B)
VGVIGVIGSIRVMKPETMMKRLALVALIGLVVTGTPTFASAATSKAKVAKAATVRCKATKAVAHTPKKVAEPTKMLKRRMGTITLVTNCGNIVIATNGVNAPVTVTMLTALAKAGFYNASLCHRLTTSGLYVLQCGDPTATGRGGPTFSYRDENLPTAKTNNYPAGTVAMANAGPNTNGSQFFLVYGNTSLGPDYTIWGKIISGLNIVKAIAAAGVKDGTIDGTPAEKIAIEKIIVK